MATPLSHMPRPQADRFVGKKNLFLVPNFVASPGTPQEGRDLIARYWSEVRDSISNLERSLGTVAKVYHEMVCDDGDAGIQHVELMNPDACTLISAICQSTGEIRSLENVELVAEHTDWQRVLSIGPASHKVLTAALEGFSDHTRHPLRANRREDFGRPCRRRDRRALHPGRPPRPVPGRHPGILRRAAFIGRAQALARRIFQAGIGRCPQRIARRGYGSTGFSRTLPGQGTAGRPLENFLLEYEPLYPILLTAENSDDPGYREP